MSDFDILADRNEIRQIVGEPLSNVLKDWLDDDEDENREYIYVGKIVNNLDPERLVRCQVRVAGTHDNTIPDSDLPWALPYFDFIGSNVGGFIVPPIGTLVTVYFENGDIYLPRYEDKVVDENNLPTQRNINYPDNMVLWETDDGSYFTINRITKDIKLHHNTGAEIKMDNTGTVTIKATVINFPHVGNASVVPDITGGPFCALAIDPLTGMPHQGTILTNSPGVVP